MEHSNETTEFAEAVNLLENATGKGVYLNSRQAKELRDRMNNLRRSYLTLLRAFAKMGVILEPVRRKRETGEPARADWLEVKELIQERDQVRVALNGHPDSDLVTLAVSISRRLATAEAKTDGGNDQ
jgi:hypothetical protein